MYGLLAGFGFALTAWGMDAFLIAQAHAAYPWLKLAVGGLAALLLLGAAGWLTAWMDKALPGLLLWGAAGGVLAWLTAHLPYEGFTPNLIRMLDPQLQEAVSYPFTETASARMIVIFWTFLIASPILGLLELPLVDASVDASAPIGRILPLSLALFMAAVAGVSADDQANQLTRIPVVELDQVIQFALDNEGKTVDRTLARQMHLGALNAVRDSVSADRRLVISKFDESIILVEVLVDFDGRWARCTVINSQTSYCKPEEPGTAGSSPAPAEPTAAPPEVSEEEAPPTSGFSTQEPAITQAAATGGAAGEPPDEKPAPAVDGPASLASAPRYTLAVEVDFEGHSFAATSRVDYTNLETAELDRLFFRLFPNGGDSFGDGSLQVSQARVNGQPAETELSVEDSVLAVLLPSPLRPGEAVRVEMDFSGGVPEDFSGGGYGIYNASENVMALAGWYPILAVYDQDGWNLDPVSAMGDSIYSEMAHYEVDLAVDSQVDVVATGRAVSEQRASGVARYHFESGPARDFFLILSPDFQTTSRTVAGVQVHSHFMPDHERAGDLALSIAADSLAVYVERFGAYPDPELDVVEAPMQHAAGVEFPGIVLIGASLYDDPSDPTFAVATAHEVAHQWWYNQVGNDVFDEPWVDEALTTYSSALYFESSQGGSGGLIRYWEERYANLVKAGLDAPVTGSLSYFESLSDPRVYSGVVYTKGGLFFHHLRREIGDDAFFQALQDYYETFQYRIATGEDLLNAFEESAGRQLDDLYQKWLFSG